MLATAFRLGSWALLVPLTGGLMLGAYLFRGDSSGDLGYWRQFVLHRMAVQVVDDLPAPAEKASFVVLPLLSDLDRYVEAALRARLRRIGSFEVLEASSFDRLVVRGSGSSQDLDDLEERAAGRPSIGGDYLLLGQVVRFEQLGSSGAVLELRLRMLDGDSGERVWEREYRERMTPSLWSPSYLGAYAGSLHWLVRILVWLGFVALLPLVLIKPIRGSLRRETHSARLWAWLLLSAAGVLVAYALLGLGEIGFSRGLMLGMAALGCVAYNLFVLSQVARVMR